MGFLTIDHILCEGKKILFDGRHRETLRLIPHLVTLEQSAGVALAVQVFLDSGAAIVVLAAVLRGEVLKEVDALPHGVELLVDLIQVAEVVDERRQAHELTQRPVHVEFRRRCRGWVFGQDGLVAVVAAEEERDEVLDFEEMVPLQCVTIAHVHVDRRVADHPAVGLAGFFVCTS